MATTISGTTGIDKVQDASIYPEDLVQKLTLATAQATTSGTFKDFTGIPSWVKRITFSLNGVSTNGSSAYIIQLGSGSFTTTGYLSAASYGAAAANATSGLIVNANLSATTFQTGICTITHLGSNVWTSSSVTGANAGGVVMCLCSGGVTLAGTLDMIRLTTINGTDTFDAGSVNIMYEG
jgi:hypothetical protein